MTASDRPVNEDEFAYDPDQDFSDIDLETEADFVAQGPEMEWFNDYGPEVSSLIQINLPDFESVALFASETDLVYPMLMEQEMVPDMLDDMDVENIQLEMDDTAQDVPYEYQYWLHGVSEFPDDAPTAPPESGDVDENGNIVP